MRSGSGATSVRILAPTTCGAPGSPRIPQRAPPLSPPSRSSGHEVNDAAGLTPRGLPPPASAELEDLARDNEPLDFGGALADLGELGVAKDALHRKFRDVAGAAMELHRARR